MNFNINNPDVTKISLGGFRILEGVLEEKILYIQHKKIGEIEPFCREIWQKISFDVRDIYFDLSPNVSICIFSCRESRKTSYRYGKYFIDGKGFVCARVNVFMNSGEIVCEDIFVTIHGCRVRAKIK